MYRALYLYNIGDLHYDVAEAVNVLYRRSDLPESIRQLPQKILIHRWFHYHLTRIQYIRLRPCRYELTTCSVVHNEFLIAYPNLTSRMYQLMGFCPHYYPDDMAELIISPHDLILKYAEHPDCSLTARDSPD